MKDSEIIQLYEERSENAIKETDRKYGRFCSSIAFRILFDKGETEECVNDSYFKVWKAIPPSLPEILSVFIGRIVRNTAFDIYEKKNRKKRGGGEIDLVLDELSECVDDGKSVETEVEGRETGRVIKNFLDKLDTDKRRIFILRYWHVMPVKEIAEMQGLKENNVKVILHRLREQLKKELEENGIY